MSNISRITQQQKPHIEEQSETPNVFSPKIVNSVRLVLFLSNEPKRSDGSTEYIDPVVREFYIQTSTDNRLELPDFDVEKAWERFIKSYERRFSKPRKRSGGRTEKTKITDTIKSLLAEAEREKVALSFDILKEKTWEIMKPGKSSEAMRKARTFGKDFGERVRRLAPHLSPKTATKRKVE